MYLTSFPAFFTISFLSNQKPPIVAAINSKVLGYKVIEKLAFLPETLAFLLQNCKRSMQKKMKCFPELSCKSRTAIVCCFCWRRRGSFVGVHTAGKIKSLFQTWKTRGNFILGWKIQGKLGRIWNDFFKIISRPWCWTCIAVLKMVKKTSCFVHIIFTCMFLRMTRNLSLWSPNVLDTMVVKSKLNCVDPLFWSTCFMIKYSGNIWRLQGNSRNTWGNFKMEILVNPAKWEMVNSMPFFSRHHSDLRVIGDDEQNTFLF